MPCADPGSGCFGSCDACGQACADEDADRLLARAEKAEARVQVLEAAAHALLDEMKVSTQPREVQDAMGALAKVLIGGAS